MPSRHEFTDAKALKIMWVAITLIMGGIVTFLGITGLFFFLESHSQPRELPTVSANLISPSALRAGLAKEKQFLESYGWVDREKNIVRIPIQQAIEILVYEH